MRSRKFFIDNKNRVWQQDLETREYTPLGHNRAFPGELAVDELRVVDHQAVYRVAEVDSGEPIRSYPVRPGEALDIYARYEKFYGPTGKEFIIEKADWHEIPLDNVKKAAGRD